MKEILSYTGNTEIYKCWKCGKRAKWEVDFGNKKSYTCANKDCAIMISAGVPKVEIKSFKLYKK